MSYQASKRTKQELCAALKRLMEQKPLEKITVRELTDSCGMVRQAFYYHFEDIYDLLKWMFQQEAIVMLEQQEGVLLWQEGLLQLFQYIQQNRAVCLCALKSIGRDHLKRFFHEDIYNIIHQAVVNQTTAFALQKDAPELALLTQFYVITLGGVMESYLRGELDATPEQLIAFFDEMICDQRNGAVLRLQAAQTKKEDGKA